MNLRADLGFVLARKLGSETTLAGALRMVLEAVLEIPGIDGGGVYEWREGERRLVLVTHAGLSDEFIAKVGEYSEDDPRVAFARKGVPVFAWDGLKLDGASQALGAIPEDIRGEGLTALGAIPVVHDGRLIAILNAASRGQTFFDDATCAALISLGALAGDVIARVAAEESLRASQERLQMALRAAGQEPWEWDLETGALTIGPYWSNLLPPASPLTGDPIADRREQLRRLVHPEEVDAMVAQSSASLHATGRMSVEHRVLLGDGSIRWVHTVGMVTERGEGGRPLRLSGLNTDITERRLLQASAMQGDRLGSLGRLAAGIAHEINNPLAYVVANLDFALEHTADAEPEVVSALREARTGAASVREIARDLRTLARAEDDAAGPASVAEALRKALNLTRNEITQRARLEVAVDDLPPVEGAEGRLSQVFMNLLINALHALPDDATDKVISVRASVTADQRVCVEIRDNGVGIKPEVLPRIFEPFFTTKSRERGTGLGLSICRAILNDMGATIEVETELGKGSCFRVSLRSGAPVPAPEPPKPEPRPASDRKRILVVDDEAFVANAVRRVLRAHEVEVAIGADEALAQLTRDASFDVVLCDLMMPGIDGPALFEHIRSRWPHLVAHVVFMTGGVFTDRARTFLETVEPQLIHKPFDAQTLRGAVDRAS